MELSNVHPVSALLSVSAIPGYDHARAGMLVAKMTYRVVDGVATLETQKPAKILVKDTPLIWKDPQAGDVLLGELPRDDTLRADPAFEVILLGQAHAPKGVACTQMKVAMSVGAARRELLVTGDRRWEKSVFGQRISAPTPFTTMPLAWSRAFGGQAEIEIDHESFVDVCDVRNAAGRGFDPTMQAHGMTKALKSPKPYPRFDAARVLPNVEYPQVAVKAWGDNPDPACWATVPTTSSIHGLRIPVEPKTPKAGPGLFHRAHPDWVLPQVPPAHTVVTVDGVTPDGRWTFKLPAQQVWLDVVTESREQRVQALPQMLVLLPEERSFQLIFRGFFSVPVPLQEPPPEGDLRVARLRLADGWSTS